MFAACDDGCTGLLLDKVQDLENELNSKTGHLAGGVVLPPWQDLMQADGVANELDDTWALWQNTSARLQLLPFNADEELHKKARQLLNKVTEIVYIKNLISIFLNLNFTFWFHTTVNSILG